MSHLCCVGCSSVPLPVLLLALPDSPGYALQDGRACLGAVVVGELLPVIIDDNHIIIINLIITHAD